MSFELQGLNGKVIKTHSGSSKMYKEAMGKFTDKNYLENFIGAEPAKYDKRMLNLFTQTELYSDDFLQMISSSDTYWVDNPDGRFTYDIDLPMEYPTIVENLSSSDSQPGIDGTTIELVFDKKAFVVNDRITSDEMNQDVILQVIEDPEKYKGYWKFKFRAISKNPKTDFVHQTFIQVGRKYRKLDNVIGEFTKDLSGLGMLNNKLKVVNSIGEMYGVEASVTKWAMLTKDGKKQEIQKDPYGRYKDIQYFSIADKTNPKNAVMFWENSFDTLLRIEMLKMKSNKLIWGRKGLNRDENGNPIYSSPGLWEQLHYGNVHYYTRGQFGPNLFRRILGDLFYGRVDIANRKALVYTNEAGFDLVSKSLKTDAMNQGFTFNAENYVTGSDKMNLGIQFDFSYFITRETGKVEFKHLKQLDVPQMNNYYTTVGRKAAPVFMIFDVSNQGGKVSNIREVKLRSHPSASFGFIPGRVHPEGFGKMQGMMSANKDPWYQLWMEDFAGVFLEDPTRTVLLKELPRFDGDILL